MSNSLTNATGYTSDAAVPLPQLLLLLLLLMGPVELTADGELISSDS
jgi:hypothetical protein